MHFACAIFNSLSSLQAFKNDRLKLFFTLSLADKLSVGYDDRILGKFACSLPDCLIGKSVLEMSTEKAQKKEPKETCHFSILTKQDGYGFPNLLSASPIFLG